jgi:hypothetical protein
MLKNIFSSSTFALVLFSISSAETPDGYYAPASIGGGTLNAQDSNWPVYDETISFSNTGTFTANITNGIDDPSGSGSYTYSKTGTNTASLSYTIDGPGYSFEYDLQFTGENKGIYTKFADYGGGTTDETTGPFSLSGVPVPEQFPWEDYDDFSGPTLNINKWQVSYYAGGKKPFINNGILEFSGTTKDSFNETHLDESWLHDFPNAASDLSDGGAHSNIGIAEDLNGIEFDVMMPSSVPNKIGAGLYVLDTNTYKDSLDNEARANATRAFIDLWNESGSPVIGFGLSYESAIYIPCSFDTYYRLGVVFEESKTCFYINGEMKGEFEGNFSKNYFLLRGTCSESLPFISNLDNVRVLRRSQETTEPDPVTVVSDPNGQAVVVQVGENYQWNSTLDGITLWGVEQSSDGWSSMTMRFENGRNFGNEGFYDSVAQPQPYDVTFEIDENGYIKSLEDDGDYQYYNAVSVENGVIGTIQNDEGVDSVANNGVNAVDQWFFTTRAAAEEYYYSKVNPKDWMWFDHYPWVYSNEQQDWLYFHPSGGTLMYFSNKGQAWRQFN